MYLNAIGMMFGSWENRKLTNTAIMIAAAATTTRPALRPPAVTAT
ncbi:hypothetical protein [Kineosporia rhizophila]|nr:hypothetical protein [Kineosporia rhizophila]